MTNEQQLLTAGLTDVKDPPAPPLPVTVVATPRGVTLRFAGYGDHCSLPGDGEPLLVENRGGTPYVVVWADINREEPTHLVSLEGAAEAAREEDDA
jgi:hypothetical protein